MNRAQTWLMLGGIALIAAAAGYRLGIPGENRDNPTATNPVPPVPGTAVTLDPDKAGVKLVSETVLADLSGQPQRLDQWRGKVLVVNYWATWCHPCLEEMPGFSRLQDKHRDKNVQFVGISIDNVAKILEFQRKTPISYPLLIGDIGTMERSAALGNTRQALPFTAVFDRQGHLSATKLGRYAEADLERLLLELVLR